MVIGESNTLREARRKTGKSVAEVADAIHVNPRTIYRYETGEQAPNVFMAIRLADYYNSNIKDLFHAYPTSKENNE